jgi:hypothetical protein
LAILMLERHCRMMAAPEARDGMLCGVGAAYILIVVQAHWVVVQAYWALMVRPRGVKIWCSRALTA